MTVREAGQKGGEIRQQRLGPQGDSEPGKQGDERLHDLINKGKQSEDHQD